jgi:hypothetical protein
MSRTRAEKRVEYRFENELNLTNRTELLANFKQAELELKKEFMSNSSRVTSRTNSYRIESNSDRFHSTRLISSPSFQRAIVTTMGVDMFQINADLLLSWAPSWFPS